MGDRCTGHCCRNFPLSASLENVQASARAEVAGKNHWIEQTVNGPRERNRLQDAWIVADMVIPLGKFEVSPINGRKLEVPMPYYTCRHLSEAGNCMIYHRRPQMCREYPYRGDRCEHADCTWDRSTTADKLVLIQRKGEE